MDQFDWSLPGPARFLSNVEQSILSGRNVVMALPEYGPINIRQAMCERVKNRSYRDWFYVDMVAAENISIEPAIIVKEQCIPASRAYTAQALASDEHFRNLVVYVDSIPRDQWPLWREFIEEYGHYCRFQPEQERAVFCIPVVGVRTSELPKEDITCAVHLWKGIVERIDVMLFVSQLFTGQKIPRLSKNLLGAIIVELAGTDLCFAAYLATLDLESVLSPDSILRKLAHDRNWTSDTLGPQAEWALGERDMFDGDEIDHSARVILQEDGKKKIEKRIWRGQLGVLFAFLEQRREEMLRRLGPYLSIPYSMKSGVITDKLDFELGHLLHIARTAPRTAQISESTLRLLNDLAEIRHRLAHLEPVPWEMLNTTELRIFFACS